MPRPPRVRPVILAALLAALPACAGRLGHAPEPPPTGPFRTATGDATHPRCMAPKRPGTEGSAPRCVVSFGRGTTAMTVSPDGAVALITLLDVDATAWELPELVYGHGFDPIPEEPGEAHGGEKEGPQALLVAPDSRSAIFAVEDRLVRYDLASGKVLGDFEGPEGQGMVDNVAWSPDGRQVLLTSAGDGKARLADVASGRIARTFAVDGRVVKMAFAPDGRSAALGTEVGTVAIVDLAAAAGRKPRALTPSTQEITGLGYLGETLVVAARDGKLRLFDPGTGKKLAEATAGGPITRFALAPKDGLIGVADADNIVRVFTVPALAERARYAWHQASITALAWGVGPTLLAADNDGELAAWPIPAPR